MGKCHSKYHLLFNLLCFHDDCLLSSVFSAQNDDHLSWTNYLGHCLLLQGLSLSSVIAVVLGFGQGCNCALKWN